MFTQKSVFIRVRTYYCHTLLVHQFASSSVILCRLTSQVISRGAPYPHENQYPMTFQTRLPRSKQYYIMIFQNIYTKRFNTSYYYTWGRLHPTGRSIMPSAAYPPSPPQNTVLNIIIYTKCIILFYMTKYLLSLDDWVYNAILSNNNCAPAHNNILYDISPYNAHCMNYMNIIIC